MLKKILIPLDETPYTQEAIRAAAAISGDVSPDGNVDVEGLGILDTAHFPAGRFASLVSRDSLMEEARDRVHETLQSFRRQAMSMGFKESQIHGIEAEGAPFSVIIRHHVANDLLIVGERCAFPPLQQDFSTLSGLYHRASRPVLVVHEAFKPVKSVLMLVDGSASSSRMLQAYTQLNPFPKAKVHMVYSLEEEAHFELENFFPELGRFLEAHSLDYEMRGLDAKALSRLPKLVETLEASVIAMGARKEQFIEKMQTAFGLAGIPVANQMVEATGAALFAAH